MSLLTKIGANILGRTVVKIGRRVLRENKIKREAYHHGYDDAKLGKERKYRRKES